MERVLLALAIVVATRSPAWATIEMLGSKPFSTVPTVALPDTKP
jgi:hypothetical protein